MRDGAWGAERGQRPMMTNESLLAGAVEYLASMPEDDRTDYVSLLGRACVRHFGDQVGFVAAQCPLDESDPTLAAVLSWYDEEGRAKVRHLAAALDIRAYEELLKVKANCDDLLDLLREFVDEQPWWIIDVVERLNTALDNCGFLSHWTGTAAPANETQAGRAARNTQLAVAA